MTTPLKNFSLTPSKAPNLPIAPVQYSQQYQDQLNNALRLYFNQIDNYNQTATSDTGGKFIKNAYIAAGDTANQYATAANTPTIIQWNTLFYGNGFTLNADNTATALYTGIYKITYSLQFANNDNAQHQAIVWLRINGVDVAGSTTIFTVPIRKTTSIFGFVCGYSEVVFQLNTGDKVGLWWGTDQAASSGGAQGVYIYYQGAQTTPMAYPSTPSAIGSITFVSAV